MNMCGDGVCVRVRVCLNWILGHEMKARSVATQGYFCLCSHISVFHTPSVSWVPFLHWSAQHSPSLFLPLLSIYFLSPVQYYVFFCDHILPLVKQVDSHFYSSLSHTGCMAIRACG